MSEWITGDFHRNIGDLRLRCDIVGVKQGDLVIVAGDDCLNYYGPDSDKMYKETINKWGIQFLFVNGNHQNKPENVQSYTTEMWNGGKVLVEPQFPNLLFAVDGEIYTINGKTVAVCGGAYSVDKYIRVMRGALSYPKLLSDEELNYLNQVIYDPQFKYDKKILDKIVKKVPPCACFWWPDEQPNNATKKRFEDNLELYGWKVDYVVTHTVPYKYIPTEMFLSGVNQSSVDDKTERWLNSIERKLTYDKWYGGHYHADKKVNDSMQLLFKNLIALGTTK